MKEEQIICELNPLNIVYFSWDDEIAPCVYLNQAKKGTCTRIYRGNRFEIERGSFGNIQEEEFSQIWQKKKTPGPFADLLKGDSA